jgi:SPP1 family predicted phage head-tail adaptor
MRAGPLDRFITIQNRTITRNAQGADLEAWGTFAQVWASKKDYRGEEFFSAQKENAQIETMWRIRYLTGLKSEMRISYDGKLYDILQISELGRREGFELLTKASIQ